LKLVLDTSILVALRRGDSEVQRALKDRRAYVEELGASRLTEYELKLGGNYLWKKHGDARELAWLDEIFSWLRVYEIDEEVVSNAADVQGQALRSGKPFPDMDLLIALSGKSGSELLTLDEDQLKMKESLKAKGVAVRSP